jgi:hypothetical protein
MDVEPCRSSLLAVEFWVSLTEATADSSERYSDFRRRWVKPGLNAYAPLRYETSPGVVRRRGIPPDKRTSPVVASIWKVSWSE